MKLGVGAALAGIIPLIRVELTEVKVAGIPPKLTEVLERLPKFTPPMTKLWSPLPESSPGKYIERLHARHRGIIRLHHGDVIA